MEDANDGNLAWLADRDRRAQFQPELVMPTQYEDLHRSTARRPEVRLMVAVLRDAVRCYQESLHATRPGARRLFRETAAWFAADAPEEPFSFVSICAVLDIDADCFREHVLTPFRSRTVRHAA